MWRAAQWPTVGVLCAAALVLGYVGFRDHLLRSGEPHGPLDALYRTLQLFVLESGWVGEPIPWTLEVARFLAPALAAFAALSALAVIFAGHLRGLRLRLLRGHVVVCGAGRKGGVLTEHLLAQGRRVVVVDRDPQALGTIGARESGAAVIAGDATDPVVLRRAGLRRAASVVCVSDDNTNAAVSIAAAAVDRRRSGVPLTCYVHLTDFEVWRLIRDLEMNAGASRANAMRLEFFNAYEGAAAILLDPQDRFAPKQCHDAPCRPHIVIVGLGGLGQSLIVRAATVWRLTGAAPMSRPLITVVDFNASGKLGALCVRFPALNETCELLPHDMDVRSSTFEEAAFVFPSADGPLTTTVYVCLGDERRSLQSALTLAQRLRGSRVPVVARMTEDRGLASLLHDAAGAVTAFPMVALTCTPERIFEGTHERLARSLREGCGAPALPDTGTSAIGEWERLDEAEREAWRREADEIGVRLSRAGFGIAPLNDWSAPPLHFTDAEVARIEPRESHRGTVRHLPSVLSFAGFSVYRLGEPSAHADRLGGQEP